MNKTWLVAIREFRQQVRKRGFWLSSMATPLILLVVWAVTGGDLMGGAPQEGLLAELKQADRPDQVIGFVDQAGLVRSIPEPVPPDLFRAYPDAPAAESALARGQIGAYYVIPPDYRETGAIRRVSPRLSVNPSDRRWFNWVLVANLLPGADLEQVARLRQPFYASGPRFVLTTPEGQTGAEGNRWLPFLVSIAVMMPLFTGGAFLFQSLAQEKSSRVMEILLASLRPRQLFTGKLLGLGLLILVQYAMWAVLGLLASRPAGLALTATGRDVSRLWSGVSLSGDEVILAVLFALGGYLLYAGLMSGVGALARDVEDSRAWVFVVSLPMTIPIYLWMVIASAPNGPLAVALSLIPFSAPVAMLMRMTLTRVPDWEIAASLVLLLLAGLGVIRLMARLFRVQTLLSGETISVRRFLAAFQS
jgi:ABC-2 type transport system permease protein